MIEVDSVIGSIDCLLDWAKRIYASHQHFSSENHLSLECWIDSKGKEFWISHLKNTEHYLKLFISFKKSLQAGFKSFDESDLCPKKRRRQVSEWNYIEQRLEYLSDGILRALEHRKHVVDRSIEEWGTLLPKGYHEVTNEIDVEPERRSEYEKHYFVAVRKNKSWDCPESDLDDDLVEELEEHDDQGNQFISQKTSQNSEEQVNRDNSESSNEDEASSKSNLDTESTDDDPLEKVDDLSVISSEDGENSERNIMYDPETMSAKWAVIAAQDPSYKRRKNVVCATTENHFGNEETNNKRVEPEKRSNYFSEHWEEISRQLSMNVETSDNYESMEKYFHEARIHFFDVAYRVESFDENTSTTFLYCFFEQMEAFREILKEVESLLEMELDRKQASDSLSKYEAVNKAFNAADQGWRYCLDRMEPCWRQEPRGEKEMEEKNISDRYCRQIKNSLKERMETLEAWKSGREPSIKTKDSQEKSQTIKEESSKKVAGCEEPVWPSYRNPMPGNPDYEAVNREAIEKQNTSKSDTKKVSAKTTVEVGRHHVVQRLHVKKTFSKQVVEKKTSDQEKKPMSMIEIWALEKAEKDAAKTAEESKITKSKNTRDLPERTVENSIFNQSRVVKPTESKVYSIQKPVPRPWNLQKTGEDVSKQLVETPILSNSSDLPVQTVKHKTVDGQVQNSEQSVDRPRLKPLIKRPNPLDKYKSVNRKEIKEESSKEVVGCEETDRPSHRIPMTSDPDHEEFNWRRVEKQEKSESEKMEKIEILAKIHAVLDRAANLVNGSFDVRGPVAIVFGEELENFVKLLDQIKSDLKITGFFSKDELIEKKRDTEKLYLTFIAVRDDLFKWFIAACVESGDMSEGSLKSRLMRKLHDNLQTLTDKMLKKMQKKMNYVQNFIEMTEESRATRTRPGDPADQL